MRTKCLFVNVRASARGIFVRSLKMYDIYTTGAGARASACVISAAAAATSVASAFIEKPRGNFERSEIRIP